MRALQGGAPQGGHPHHLQKEPPAQAAAGLGDTVARISGVDIPDNKRSEIALTYIFGLGRKSVLDILKKANIDPARKAGDLTDEEIGKLRRVIEAGYQVEGDLRAQVGMNIKRLVDI